MANPADDRGTPCDVAALSGAQIGRRALGLDRYYDAHTKSELAATGKIELAVALAGGVVGVVLWQFVFQRWPVFGPIGIFAGYVVVAPVTAMIVWRISLGAARRRRFRRIADVYLSTARCASCAYALAGLAVEDDGCLVCPECGAAWQADRVGEGESPTPTDAANPQT